MTHSESGKLYEEAIRIALDSNPQRAMDLYSKYQETYKQCLEDAQTEYKVADYMTRIGKASSAIRIFERLVKSDSTPVDIKKNCITKINELN